MSTSSLALVAIGLSVFALAAAVAVAVQVGRLRRTLETRARDATALPSRSVPAPGPRDARALTRVAVVRYDAFGDLAGALSFSAALLDDAGNGLVLSSINGRSETRTYAKGVTGGQGDAPLSPEEQEAIAEAFASPAVAGRIAGSCPVLLEQASASATAAVAVPRDDRALAGLHDDEALA